MAKVLLNVFLDFSIQSMVQQGVPNLMCFWKIVAWKCSVLDVMVQVFAGLRVLIV